MAIDRLFIALYSESDFLSFLPFFITIAILLHRAMRLSDLYCRTYSFCPRHARPHADPVTRRLEHHFRRNHSLTHCLYASAALFAFTFSVAFVFTPTIFRFSFFAELVNL